MAFARTLAIMVLLGYTNHVEAVLTVQLSKTFELAKPETTVLVNCITNPRDANVRWQKGGDPVPLQPAVGAEPEVYYMPNNTLKIKKIKRRNSGTYSCIAKYQAESTVEDFEVEVMYIQQINEMQSLETYAGSRAQMICEPPRGKPQPKAVWLKDGKPFFDPKIDQSTFTLDIESAKMSDTANYTCIAMGYKNRTTTASLKVYTKGSFSAFPKMMNVVEGKTAKFDCISKTVPALTLSWLKKGEECDKDGGNCKSKEQPVLEIDPSRFKVNNGILQILNVKPEDEGIYLCTKTLGSQYESIDVSLNIIELIKVTFSKPRKYIDMNESPVTYVECPYRGDNVTSISWVRNNTGTLPANMVVNGSNLIIKNPTLKDSAFYTCTIKGKINTDVKSLNISIYKSLRFTRRPANISVALSKPLWVHCNGTGYPKPRLFYFKSGINGGELNTTFFKQLPNGTLHVPVMKREFVGSYMCILKNDYPGGSKLSPFYINILSSGAPGGSDSSPMHRTIGIAVGCAGVYILLVIGLMIYCRARRARLLKGIITEVDGEGKDPLVGNDNIPLESIKNLEQWEFDRDSLQDLQTLGHGKMGRVYKANANLIKNGEKKTLVVVKEFPSDEKDHREEFNSEVEMFTQLNHENVIKLLGVATNRSPWLLITDYGEEGDLKSYLTNTKDLDVSDRLGMGICVAKGMDYLIKQHYMHRDLAARNCVVRSNKSVLITFLSLCEDTYKDDYYTLNDAPVPLRWLSPEAIQEENYSEKSDVWSFGVTIWEIFSGGENPYSSFDNDAVLKGVCMDLRLTKPTGCPNSIYSIMESCWNVNPDERPNFSDLKTLVSEASVDE